MDTKRKLKQSKLCFTTKQKKRKTAVEGIPGKYFKRRHLRTVFNVLKTVLLKRKECKLCHQEMVVNNSAKVGYSSKCKACKNAERRKKTQEKVQGREKEQNEEKWVPVKNHESYQVTKSGRFRNASCKELKVNRKRYVILKTNGKNQTFLRALLVAQTFIENPEDKRFLHFKDGNRDNYHKNNLKWVTRNEMKQLMPKDSKGVCLLVDEASEEELFEHFEVLYKEYGNCAFSDITLPEQQKFFNRMRTLNFKMADFAKRKNLKDQFQENRRKLRDISMKARNKNYGKTFEEIKEELKALVEQHGCIVLHEEWLKQNQYQYINSGFRNRKITLKSIAVELSKEEEYKESCRQLYNKNRQYNNNRIHWTPELFLKKTLELIECHGDIPPHKWFTRGSGRKKYLGYWRYMYDQGKTVDDVRKEHGIQRGYVSRNGMYWKSWAEVNVSNFLYARGIKHTSGEKYGNEYKNYGSHKKGYYDVCIPDIVYTEIWAFHSLDQQQKKGKCPINVQEYIQKRRQKEKYNEKHNPKFLGLEYDDCMDDDVLTEKFKPFIGVIEPSVIDKISDKICTPAKWSLKDRTLERVRKVLSHTNNVLPRSQWFCKAGRFKNRKIEEWEKTLGYSLGSLDGNISKIGRAKIVEELQADEPPRGWTKKPIEMIDPTTNKVIKLFASKGEAAKYVTENVGGSFNANRNSIKLCCSGKAKTCQNFLWRYKIVH